ncbi:hypothetical protein TNCT_422421 [Trichonephila clavata]|uniref:Uncharacterized protein n=1 Tax=Trichonephila clavata TaxID=2740835 RepID=A0A8X6LIP0_TRICU|nr:hypothetical protein TNCT_422421 [Trichonephila clavata]
MHFQRVIDVNGAHIDVSVLPPPGPFSDRGCTTATGPLDVLPPPGHSTYYRHRSTRRTTAIGPLDVLPPPGLFRSWTYYHHRAFSDRGRTTANRPFLIMGVLPPPGLFRSGPYYRHRAFSDRGRTTAIGPFPIGGVLLLPGLFQSRVY